MPRISHEIRSIFLNYKQADGVLFAITEDEGA